MLRCAVGRAYAKGEIHPEGGGQEHLPWRSTPDLQSSQEPAAPARKSQLILKVPRFRPYRVSAVFSLKLL